MAKIKKGYNDIEAEIRISAVPYHRAEVWLIQNGLPEFAEQYRETLSYASIEELIELKKEIEEVITTMAGIKYP